MEKKILINGREMTMRSSAILPRQYRFHFGHDLMRDMAELQKSYDKVLKDMKDASEEDKQQAQFSVTDLTIFENVAWLMLKNGGEDVGADPDEFLDSIDGVFSIYEILPVVFELWTANTKTTSIPKKK